VLKDNGISGHQGRRGAPKDLPEGEIPGHYGEHDSERFERDKAPRGITGNHFASEVFLGVFGEVVTAQGAFLDFGTALSDWLAHLLRYEFREIVAASSEEIRSEIHFHRSFAESRASPLRECVVRLLQETCDSAHRCFRIGIQRFTCGRIDRLNGHIRKVA